MIDFITKRKLNSVLGLCLDGSRLEAVVVRRAGGGLQVQKSLAAPLTLSPLTGDPVLVAREIRNHLDAAGIREKKCVVCIPLNWVLTMQTALLPELSPEDVGEFLQIEAERGFPSGPDNLYISNSLSIAPDGGKAVLQMGVPRNHLALLEQVLKAAQLKPVQFSLGISSLQTAGTENAPPLLALALANQSLDLQVTSGGGIVSLRSLDGALETEGAQKRIDADLVGRELRITIGQLPASVGGALKTLKIFGRGDLARQFAEDISARAKSLGLKLEPVDRVGPIDFAETPAPELMLSPALSLAMNCLAGVKSPDFLPPKVSPWKQMLATKFSSAKLAYAAGAAAALALLVGAAFGYQQWQIGSYEGQLSSIQEQVTELQADKDQIRKFRPWFEENYRSLRIIKKIVEAFPPEGSVTARTLEIRDLSTVTCTGTAVNNASYLRMNDELRKAKEISNLNNDIHGQNPMQFTFSFQWEGGKASAN